MNILQAKNEILSLVTQVPVNPDDNSVYAENHSIETALLWEEKRVLERILTELANTSFEAGFDCRKRFEDTQKITMAQGILDR